MRICIGKNASDALVRAPRARKRALTVAGPRGASFFDFSRSAVCRFAENGIPTSISRARSAPRRGDSAILARSTMKYLRLFGGFFSWAMVSEAYRGGFGGANGGMFFGIEILTYRE